MDRPTVFRESGINASKLEERTELKLATAESKKQTEAIRTVRDTKVSEKT